MNQPDPLRSKRLGLGGILLVSGGVLLAGSVFVAPAINPLAGGDVLTDLASTASMGPPRTPAAEPGAPRSTPVAPRPADTGTSLVPVYWIGDIGGHQGLFREFHASPAKGSGDPIVDAVQLMTGGTPLDPDYGSPWAAAGSVSSSISTQNVITLDLSSDAFSDTLGEEEALLAVQQLVYTVTAAAASAGLITGGEASSVVVLVDGAAGYRAFGAVDLDGKWTRDHTVLAPVWIIDPQEGVVAGTDGLIVHGLAPAGEDAVRWRVARLPPGQVSDAGTSLREGTAVIEGGKGTSGTYSFPISLPPGDYEITVSLEGEAIADSTSVVVR